MQTVADENDDEELEWDKIKLSGTSSIRCHGLVKTTYFDINYLGGKCFPYGNFFLCASVGIGRCDLESYYSSGSNHVL
ncbi:hypothetical protein NPIL_585671 [Nephila pilipes]|uniref:Uncharacterized protein n=1 Tax=Nephila pilipes TaxID=299642 RepID=A0A8X6IHS2_NEPPI|nr:hypothetical protein NPIL_585671 [Nephila pilipes]